MNLRSLLLATGPLLLAGASAQTGPAPTPGVAPAAAAVPGGTVSYQQQLYAPASTLVAPDKAREIVEAFRAAYSRLGQPRLLLYVNRDLVDQQTGLRLTSRLEHTEGTQGESTSSGPAAPPAAPAPPASGSNAATTPREDAPQEQGLTLAQALERARAYSGNTSRQTREVRVTADNTYVATPPTPTTLADRQTVRDVERLFGRPLRAGGAQLADQRVAAALIADQPLDHFTTATGEAARRDRAALAQIADVVIEVLISSRTVTVPGIATSQTVTVPDIQVTAIRLRDSAIIGQASATDVLGKDRQAGRVLRQFDVNDVAEATALALMEDLASAPARGVPAEVPAAR